jgi:AcrR family transcriptional regulator
MARAAAPKRRLTRLDWFEAALDALMQEGIAGVRIERLAGELGVTRGSFYHHFKNRRELLHDLLEHWLQVSTVAIRDEVGALGLDPVNTLLVLSRMIRHRGGSTFDVAFRAWAVHDEMARDYVARADEIRLAFTKPLFEALGFDDLDAENRARLYLYYEMGEPTFLAPQSRETEDALIAKRIELLTRRDGD